MTSFLIGQRGTGKSHLLKVLGEGVDLDQWIAEKEARDLGDIFKALLESHGEQAFRDLEMTSLAELLKKSSPSLVSLGAGFPLEQLSPQDEKVWVRRSSDRRGRIFLDRPRLNPELSALEEYELRFQRREPIYADQADWVLEVPEGQHLAPGILRRLFKAGQGEAGFKPHSGIWTLRTGDSERFAFFDKRVKSWGFQYFEMRTDLLHEKEFHFWAQHLAKDKVLLSYRNEGTGDLRQFFNSGPHFFDIDWALELGVPPLDLGITSLSLHSEDGTPLESSLRRLDDCAVNFPQCHLKWSPFLRSWGELDRALKWQSKDPKRRSLLPRSTDGRWGWVRQILKDRQKLHFVCEFKTEGRFDQPSLLEWLQNNGGLEFAAILGSPVEHSWTPAEQSEFFGSHGGFSVFRVRIDDDEWSDAWPVLNRCGLRAAAVTSPLKKRAMEVCDHPSPQAQAYGAVNTLIRQGEIWEGTNTDACGLEKQLRAEGLLEWSGPVLVWGGGGTLDLLRRLFPQAEFYSVRTQEPREGSTFQVRLGPLMLVWAAGARDASPRFPCAPEVVLDLNYREDSAAREFALSTGARYISGEGMFRAQAQAQRDFWSKFL